MDSKLFKLSPHNREYVNQLLERIADDDIEIVLFELVSKIAILKKCIKSKDSAYQSKVLELIKDIEEDI